MPGSDRLAKLRSKEWSVLTAILVTLGELATAAGVAIRPYIGEEDLMPFAADVAA